MTEILLKKRKSSKQPILIILNYLTGASTVPAPNAGTQGRASRGSFVSVTDVSSDEELDLDNI